MSRRNYSPTFKDDAVQMVADGHSIQQVAGELGIPNGTLWNWVRDRKKLTTPMARTTLSPEQQELRELRQRVADLEQENAFLGKASAYFASKRRP